MVLKISIINTMRGTLLHENNTAGDTAFRGKSRMNELTLQRKADELSHVPETRQNPHQLALDLLLRDRRSAATARAYASDLRRFFAWGGSDTSAASVEALCNLSAGKLAMTLNAYSAHLRGTVSEATVNRRLSAVRSLLRIARRLGAGNVDPAGLVDNERVTAYRDTRGPDLKEIIKLLALPNRTTVRGMRDYAILRLLWSNALRRSELCGANVADLDIGASRLRITGKGRGTQSEWISLRPKTLTAIREYLEARRGAISESIIPQSSSAAGGEPLFASHDRRTGGENRRLTQDGLYKLVAGYGRRIGIALRPHGMRHAAITAHLTATGGDILSAQDLARHADIRTTRRYDDNRQDRQGQATEVLEALA